MYRWYRILLLPVTLVSALHADWNTEDQLEFLQGLLLSLSLPPYQDPGNNHGDGSHGDDTWEKACSTVWDYVKDVVDEEYNNTALYSRWENHVLVRLRPPLE